MAGRTSELEELRFEFSDVAAHSDQSLEVLPVLRFQLVEEEVLCAVRDFQIAVLEFEFFHTVAVFRIFPGRCFRTLRHLRFRDRIAIAEARGKTEDAALAASFFRLLHDGTRTVPGERFRRLHCPMTFVRKQQNIAGTQLADLCGYPSSRHILKPAQPNLAFDVVRAHLYQRDGETGRLVLPWKRKWAAPTIAGGRPSFENSRTLCIIPDALRLARATPVPWSTKLPLKHRDEAPSVAFPG